MKLRTLAPSEIKALSRAQMRRLDEVAINKLGIPGVVLMENAGRAAAWEALNMLGAKRKAKVVIFCGRGNNGGDGYVAARHLLNHGTDSQVVVLAELSQIAGDARTNLAVLQQMTAPVLQLPYPNLPYDIEQLTSGASLIIDALLGTGVAGTVREPMLSVIKLLNQSGKPILAVDIPSGLDCDTGMPLGEAIRATKSVTFAASKTGFTKGQGPAHVGELVVADIGIPPALLKQVLDQ